ncbi:MAG: hypothetical protein NXI20_19585 [bacterium]|nr:hypothetical protein [bacterium]
MKKLFVLSLSVLFLAVTGCEDDDPAIPESLVAGFSSTTLGLSLDDNSADITIEFSRAAAESGTIELTIGNEQNAEYGTDYETSPAASGGVISIPVASGDNNVSLTITKLLNPEFGEIKSFEISLSSIPETGEVGTNGTVTVTFAENPISSGATLDLTVGGATQPNQVYVDLSRQTETVVARDSWDLGFSSGDEFSVILNSSLGMLAKALDKTSLNDVTADDTVGMNAQLDLGAIQSTLYSGQSPDWLSESITWADYPTGDLNETAISEISSTDSDNPVYIINRGTDPEGNARGWMKVRIIRNGSGYTLKYAEIAATSFDELEITKDSNFNFIFASLSGNIVSVQPEKSSWDIAFTTYTATTTLDGMTFVPFKYNDYVIQNRNTEGVAQVLTETGASYDSFSAEDAADLDFSGDVNSIGSSWRYLDFQTFTYFVSEDRFYVIKDPEDNLYKLKFTRMLDATTGERGFPQIQYELL